MIFSREAEAAVLGGILLNPVLLEPVSEVVRPADFYEIDNQLIYSAMLDMGNVGETIDPLTVAERLERTDKDRHFLAVLTTMLGNTAGASNVKAYAMVIASKAVERRILQVSADIAEIAHSHVDLDSKINSVHSLVEGLECHEDVHASDFNATLKSLIGEIDEKFRGENKAGLQTGIQVLDDRFQGIDPTDLWILAARPSMGKTTLAMNIVENISLSGGAVLVFSMEMSDKQLARKLLASTSGVGYDRLRSGKLNEDDRPRLGAGMSKLKDKRIFIVDKPNLHINHMAAISRKFAKHGLSLIVVDYLQLGEGKGDKRFDQVSDMSRGLKAIAKNNQVPVLALSQLSRKVDDRKDKRPVNSDLRESGQIEQDADIITFIHREEVYDPDTHMKGLAELITTKFREGEVGTDVVKANLRYSRFEDLPVGYGIPEEPKEPKFTYGRVS